jgi:hypothetical protein
MLEMDRILRPGGRVYIRDTLAIMDELQEIAKAMDWHVTVRDTSEGPHASYRIFTADKRLLRGWSSGNHEPYGFFPVDPSEWKIRQPGYFFSNPTVLRAIEKDHQKWKLRRERITFIV